MGRQKSQPAVLRCLEVACAVFTYCISGESNLADRAGHDEDANVVRERIGGDDKESMAIRPVAERPADDHLVVHQRHLDARGRAVVLRCRSVRRSRGFRQSRERRRRL